MLWMRAMNADLEDVFRRARFEAVRRRVFSEMADMTSRWRLALVVPFHALVIGILASRDFPRERLAIQIAASVTLVATFLIESPRPGRRAPCSFSPASRSSSRSRTPAAWRARSS